MNQLMETGSLGGGGLVEKDDTVSMTSKDPQGRRGFAQQHKATKGHAGQK